MKTFFYLVLLSSILFQSCKKENGKTYLDGNGVIEGTTIYRDSLAGEDHAVTNIVVRVSVKKDETYKKLFELTSSDGDFRIESLTVGTYQFETSFAANGKVYKDTTEVTLGDGEYQEVELVLLPDPELPETNTYTISGTAHFDNPLTGAEANAAGAVVSVLNALGEEVAATTAASNGSFEFSGLEAGSYTLMAELSTSPDISGPSVDYEGTLLVTIASADLTSQEIELEWTANSTLLRIHVTDSLQNPLSGASVCIYSNQDFMTANAYSCIGSERNASTNSQGNVLFSGLSTVRYYIASTKNVGVIELYSDSLEATLTPLPGNVLTTRNIQLRQEW